MLSQLQLVTKTIKITISQPFGQILRVEALEKVKHTV